MTTKSRLLALAIVLLCSHVPAYAIDGVSFELIGRDKLQIARVGLQWKWQNTWYTASSMHIGGYWDGSIARWRATQFQNIPDNSQRINDIGIAAVFRLQGNDNTGFYAEVGTGPHYLSDYYDNDGRRQSSHLVFNSHAGVGFVWKNGLDLGLRAMHISNGSTSEPNDAINVVGVGVKYWW
jgi:hypothetical protein